MEDIKNIEIRVTGHKGGVYVSPDTYDIREIISMLDNIEIMLYPDHSKGSRPLISYELREGSVRHIFKTAAPAVIALGSVLTGVNENESINGINPKVAKAIEEIQKHSYKSDFSFEIKLADENALDTTRLEITPKTKFTVQQNYWSETEFYVYGTLVNIGGKTKATIKLDTEEYGTLSIESSKEFLLEQKDNLLYKMYGAHVLVKQNVLTGEIETGSLKLMSLHPYSPKYDDEELNKRIENAKDSWEDVDDPNQWLRNLRGDND